MKTCSRCKQEKSLDEFGKHNTRGLQAWCRDCKQEYDRQRYTNNRDHFDDLRRHFRKRRRAEWIEYKSTLKCMDCSEDHPAVIEFHHRDPAEKDGDLANLVRYYGWDRLKEELEKCDVLCANCHRKRHWVVE